MTDTIDQQQSLAVGVGESVLSELPAPIGTPLAAPTALDQIPSGSEAPIQTYDENFPSLAPVVPSVGEQHGRTSPEGKQPRIVTSKVTTLFHIPVEERVTANFGAVSQSTICSQIMKVTGTNLEVSQARDESLSFLVYGTAQGVKEARKLIQEKFQRQASKTIMVPKENHRFLLGKQGKLLRKLETDTATKISFPRQNEESNKITISGTKEGIEKAIHEIRIRSDDLSKQTSVRLDVPQMFHAFIQGPNGDRVSKWVAETGVRINIPPSSMKKDEISIAGEKEAVQHIVDIIQNETQEMTRKFSSVSVEVSKAQHKYVIGPKWQTIGEILAKTGVSVEMPSLDDPSETVTLRGPTDKLGQGLSMVYEKANSVVRNEVKAPAWMHRHIIGKKGANIQALTQDFTNVRVDFTGDAIILEGPMEEVDAAFKALGGHVAQLMASMKMREIEVEPVFHGHIIGRQGARLAKLKGESSVAVIVPEKDSNIIRLEGNPEDVDRIAKEILDSVDKLKNEVDMPVQIDHRFHGMVIGPKGETIRDIRNRFNQVFISFPEPNSRTNTIHVRGNKQDVQAAVRHLKMLGEEFAENNYVDTVNVFDGFQELIVEKRAALKSIREDLGVRVSLPSRGSTERVVTLTGKRNNVVKAVEQVNKIQDELESITSDDVMIPCKFHDQLIGRGSAIVRSIESDCGGVSIRFPPPHSKSDKVIVRGPKEDVKKAKQMLLEMYQDKEQRSYTEEIKAKPQHHRFLIGKGGSTINKLRETTQARFVFPDQDSADRETIIIIGRKEGVLKAKKELTSLIAELDSVSETTVDVDPRYHRYFVARRGEVLREIAEQYGGVTVSFPRVDEQSSQVTIKGSKDIVPLVKARLIEIVEDLEATVHTSVVIPQKFHAGLMGHGGRKIKDLTAEHQVQIKFPDRRAPPVPAENGIAELEGEGDEPNPGDVIKISGRPEKCEKAKAALLACVPVTIEVPVAFELHRFIIGQKGKGVRDLMDQFDVNISIPPAHEESDVVRVTGSASDVERAREGIENRVAQLEDEKQDRIARQFALKVSVPSKYHPKLIGRRGATVAQLRDKYGVNIQIPGKDDPEPDNITITGYESKAYEAKAEVDQIIGVLESMTETVVTIDPRIHSRIIGARGKGVRSLMDQYKVDVKFPRAEDEDSGKVVVMGDPEAVEDCVEHLLNLEEEYLLDVQEEEEMKQFTNPRQTAHDDDGPTVGKSYVVTGAPWEAPNVGSTDAFPTLGGNLGSSGPAPAWGPPRRH